MQTNTTVRKHKYRFFALILALCLVMTMIPLPAGLSFGTISVAAADGVSYLDYMNGTFEEKSVTDYTTIDENSTTWYSGWYVVGEEVSISERITVSGDVYLILADGATLTASQGISVTKGNSLTIYAQSDGEKQGKLTATGTGNSRGYAGIGGNNATNQIDFGTIQIYGGDITATGGTRAAGIGGGGVMQNGAELNGKIVIGGGKVTATGGR